MSGSRLCYENLIIDEINKEGNGIYGGTNSCFFNATNQMLFHIPEFREFLIRNNNLFKNNITLNLIQLFTRMKNNKVNSSEILHDKTLGEFYKNVQLVFFNDVSGQRQQDASELLTKYIDIIIDEIFSLLLIPNTIPFIRNNLINDLYINLPIFNIISKFITSRTCISNPNKIESLIIEYINLKNIEIEKNTEFNINLNDRIEDLTADNNFEPCKDKDINGKNMVQTKKNTRVTESYETNEYIIIHLKRFVNLNPDPTGIPNITKLENPIQDYRINNNNDEFIITDKYNNPYKLIGSICHGGGTDGGHYWYFHKINNVWKCFNDSSDVINQIPNSSEQYILLFKKHRDIQIYQNINIHNIDILNQVILYNTDIFITNFNTDIYYKYDNQEKIIFYIKLMVYYTSLYNKKSHPQYKVEFNTNLLSIKNKLTRKIQLLITAK
jgi:ubiquitin C-terminal hydrolase